MAHGQVTPKRRRAVLLRGLFLLAVSASAESEPKAVAITSYAPEVRSRNVVRLSTETCDECAVMEDFYMGNYYGFLLFMEHSLMGGHKYKEAIIKGVLDVCHDLRWSRIACGLVDMVTDRAYAERYIDPKTAPAHIVVKDGQPLLSSKELVAPLLAKPGDKETIREHLFAMLKDEGSEGNLTISQEIQDEKALARILKKHQVVVVSYAQKEKNLAEAFRSGVQTAVLQRGMQQYVREPERGGRTGKGDRKADEEKSRIAFVSAKGSKMTKYQQGAVIAYVNGVAVGDPATMDLKAKPGDKKVVELVKKVTEAAVKMATSTANDIKDSAEKAMEEQKAKNIKDTKTEGKPPKAQKEKKSKKGKPEL